MRISRAHHYSNGCRLDFSKRQKVQNPWNYYSNGHRLSLAQKVRITIVMTWAPDYLARRGPWHYYSKRGGNAMRGGPGNGNAYFLR